MEHPALERILHLEDSSADAELIATMLNLEGLACELIRASDRKSFEDALCQQEFSLILCDHGVPGYDGFTALQTAIKVQSGVPVIMLSGSLDDVHAVECLKAGATDYILKQRLPRLVPAIRRALQEARDQRKKRAADERIRAQANLLNLTRDAIAVLAIDGKIVSWNHGAEEVFGWPEAEACGRVFGELLGADGAAQSEAHARLLASGDWMGELRLHNKALAEVIVFSRWSLLRALDGRPQAILSVSSDISEKKKLEAALLRAQRMDSIGALAGGIAHDLNNALAPVLMSAELLKSCDDPETRDRFLDIIITSAQRGTGMVKQILGFARGRNSSGPLAVGDVVQEMAKIVRDTFPKSISIQLESEEGLWRVQGDATELHQVLLNLCVNARDAMPKGGQLTLGAHNIRLEAEAAAKIKVVAGAFVCVSVADTGSGISPEVLPRIFEPFFTTKGPDQGTGLGLSTLAGIVKQAGGGIDVKTQVGQGAEFRIYLPAADVSAAAPAKGDGAPLPVGRGELILLIEDEDAVRELTRTTLENFGYRVMLAQNGVQGVACFEKHRDEIRVLVTDSDMPYLDGMGAIRAIKKIRPDIPVIIASGSSRGATETQEIAAQRWTNLGKPFSVDQLLIAVAMALQN
ncbi:MAG TPA: response regulator [Verrucomicrobiae bacterium]|jgi:PAS domain S-box-containing protein|nr:response regulator [Verrucomicrobiae bacterium]